MIKFDKQDKRQYTVRNDSVEIVKLDLMFSPATNKFEKITEYIEVFYNRLRRQKRLGYLSPVAYRKQFFVWKGAA